MSLREEEFSSLNGSDKINENYNKSAENKSADLFSADLII